MIVTSLKLANVRAIEVAEFSFKPGFNLIVGVNGVGKSTALEALAVCLSGITRHMNRLRSPLRAFTSDDIRASTQALTIDCSVDIEGSSLTYLVHMPRHAAVAQIGKAGLPREQAFDTPTQTGFVGDPPSTADGIRVQRPLAVLFSTRRAVPSDRAATKAASAGGPAAAFADAFAPRELRLSEFASWMRAQEALASERAEASRVLEAFEVAVERFIPGYDNFRVTDEKPLRLLVDRFGTTVPVRHLSDGERGSLALVLDLTRRLAQANPQLVDPAGEGEAVVLIDEVDLHLHPKWQREIIKNLTATFPKAQFIATTHSPQVIGEIEHDRIQVIADGQVFSPPYAFGVDSSRVLEEIMDTPPRSAEVQTLLVELSKQVSANRLSRAEHLVADLARQIGESDPEVVRARTLLDFLGGDE
jgi:predicted ATP-binding protein involved in virulence